MVLALSTLAGLFFRGEVRHYDFSQHIEFARQLAAGRPVTPHFLFELLIVALAPLCGWQGAAIVLATAAEGLKAWLTVASLRGSGREGAELGAATALFFAMPLPAPWSFPDVYLGQVSANVWHNPTTVAVLPAALLLHVWSTRCGETAASAAGSGASSRATGSTASSAGSTESGRGVGPAARVAWRIGVLAAVQTALKPSYVFAWLPCHGLRALARLRAAEAPARRAAGRALAAALPALALLAWQALWLAAHDGGGIVLAPLAAWRLYSPHPLASLALSLAFPAVVLALIDRAAPAPPGTRLPWRFAWAVTGVAVLALALLAERGPRLAHGNFFWGADLAAYVLFVEAARRLLAAPAGWRARTAWAVLALHAASGVLYLLLRSAGAIARPL